MISKDRYFLDHNSTTPLCEVAGKAMLEIMAEPYNASSIHGYGREAKKILSTARKDILESLKSHSASLIFTSSGTESNNMALNCIKEIEKIACSTVEHISLLKPAEGKDAELISVDENGVIKLDALEEFLKKNEGQKTLVSVMHANNETGVIQPIKEISELVFKYNGFLHVDASQSFGKIDFSFDDLGADLLTISAHKINGPKGIAALVVKSGLEILPFIIGGGQEKFLRGGTENLPAIVGFAAAAKYRLNNLKEYQNSCKELIEYFESKLKAKYPKAVIFGDGVTRLPNTSNFAISGKNSETELIKLDLKGFCLSAGSACSSGRVNNSHVLKAMNVDESLVKAALRLSIGEGSSKGEIDRLLEVI